MSRQSGKPYVCARKGVKLYMPDPVVVEDQSITTAGKQKLVIDRKELDKMSGKRVLVVDDVISTGGSLKALDALAEQPQCKIVGQAAILAEGDAAERKAGWCVNMRFFAANGTFCAVCGIFCSRLPAVVHPGPHPQSIALPAAGCGGRAGCRETYQCPSGTNAGKIRRADGSIDGRSGIGVGILLSGYRGCGAAGRRNL